MDELSSFDHKVLESDLDAVTGGSFGKWAPAGGKLSVHDGNCPNFKPWPMHPNSENTCRNCRYAATIEGGPGGDHPWNWECKNPPGIRK